MIPSDSSDKQTWILMITFLQIAKQYRQLIRISSTSVPVIVFLIGIYI